jgi:cytochrome P450
MPVVRKKRPSPIMRLIQGRRSALDVLFERSYSMKMGEFSGLSRKYYFLAQPDIAQRILDADPSLYPKSDLMGTFLSQILGDGIFVSNGASWKRQRAMINPAFQVARIAEVFPQMLAAAVDMRDRLIEKVHVPQVAVDVEMTHVTADIIFRTIFSESLPRAEAESVYEAFNRYQELAYVHGVWSMAGLPQALSMARLRARPYARAIRSPLEALVRKRLEILKDSAGSAPTDILTSLISARDQEGKPFNQRELVDQVAGFANSRTVITVNPGHAFQ